ncbi:MerR family transcriptional regulator [Larkinella terrae]|uniref:MerR family transcriptional regulator n=1 Tax=Larkinella terrae TaxID=2025311 RepID=A0A7K0EQP1_9BACT|nr:MerR family transcriptional regulator [Larkinella terrae]MRS63816.1 MerR family transcriptional regulator [Larkinella terrae]
MEELTKRYYGIREVADMLGVNISKLRFYEKEFPTLKPRKNRAGDRIYTKDDISHLRGILELVEEKKLTLEGARQHLKGSTSRQNEIKQMISRLQEIRKFLVATRDQLEA